VRNLPHPRHLPIGTARVLGERLRNYLADDSGRILGRRVQLDRPEGREVFYHPPCLVPLDGRAAFAAARPRTNEAATELGRRPGASVVAVVKA
jgi:hypothetical protein